MIKVIPHNGSSSSRLTLTALHQHRPPPGQPGPPQLSSPQHSNTSAHCVVLIAPSCVWFHKFGLIKSVLLKGCVVG